MYSGGCSVQWSVEEYHQYGGEILSLRWVDDVQYGGGISLVRRRDIISTVEDAQDREGISLVRWRVIISTVEDIQIKGGI